MNGLIREIRGVNPELAARLERTLHELAELSAPATL
jgi:hypothetical protein